MNRIFFALAFTFFLSVGLPVIAAEVPADGSTGSTPQEDAGMQGVPVEVKPEAQMETQAESIPETELATSSPAGSVEPRPVPAAEAAEPAPVVVPAATVTEEEQVLTPESLPESPAEPAISPWMWLVGLLALAGGSVYGAYSFMKASQTKSTQSGNTCDAIQEALNQKKYELSLVEHETSFYEEALRVLEEKVEEKAEAEKGKVIKKIEGAAKDAILGKKGESDARAAFDTAEKIKSTYEDAQKKIKKTREILEMLRGKQGGLTAETQTLEASYVACVAQLPDAAKALAGVGIKLAAPGNRPVRAIVFDWAGVMATEAYWVWVRKNVTDVGPLISIDSKVDSGEMPHEEFVAMVAKVSGKTSEEVWRGIKSEMALNEELIALIRELKKKYKIGLLSNFTAPWLREVMDENKLWDLFDEHIISSEHKLVKPDAKIYKKMLTMLDVSAGEVVFADDRQINIDAAKKLGMRGFLFTDTEQFIKDLKTAGISVKPEESSGSKG